MKDGQLECLPGMLQASEFLSEETIFMYCDVNSEMQHVEVPTNALAFTYCQVPFVYHLAQEAFVRVHLADGSSEELTGSRLSKEWSTMVMERTNSISKVEVGMVV